MSKIIHCPASFSKCKKICLVKNGLPAAYPTTEGWVHSGGESIQPRYNGRSFETRNRNAHAPPFHRGFIEPQNSAARGNHSWRTGDSSSSIHVRTRPDVYILKRNEASFSIGDNVSPSSRFPRARETGQVRRRESFRAIKFVHPDPWPTWSHLSFVQFRTDRIIRVVCTVNPAAGKSTDRKLLD